MAICGDILHSRVALVCSNILLLGALGAHVRVVGPSTRRRRRSKIWVEERSTASGLRDADIVMMLRLQRERISGAFRAFDEDMASTPRPPTPSRARWSCTPAQ